MTGHRINLPKGMSIGKDGKIVKRPVKLSRPAQYAKAKKKKWRPAK